MEDQDTTENEEEKKKELTHESLNLQKDQVKWGRRGVKVAVIISSISIGVTIALFVIEQFLPSTTVQIGSFNINFENIKNLISGIRGVFGELYSLGILVGAAIFSLLIALAFLLSGEPWSENFSIIAKLYQELLEIDPSNKEEIRKQKANLIGKLTYYGLIADRTDDLRLKYSIDDIKLKVKVENYHC